MSKGDHAGLNQNTRRTRRLKQRLREIRAEIAKRGRTSLMDAAREATGDDECSD